MNHDYAINSNFNIGKEGTDNVLKLNGIDITQRLKGYTGSDSIDIDTDNEISVADGGVTISKLAQDVLNFLIPTGTIVPYVGNEAPDGWMMCDGRMIHDTTETHNLYNMLNNNPNFHRDATERVFLPDLSGRFIKGPSSDAEKRMPGRLKGSALPNIKAEWPILYYYGHPNYVKNDEIHDKYYSGAIDNFKEFPEYTQSPTLPGCGDTGGGHGLGWKAKFDASKSNNIYNDDVTEVTPPNMTLNYIIKL